MKVSVFILTYIHMNTDTILTAKKIRPPRNKPQLKRMGIEKDFTLEWFCERFPCGGEWDKAEAFGERKWCKGLGWARDQSHHGHGAS